MAVKKLPTTISLALEVQNGVDSDGNPKYSKKSFSGVKAGLDPAVSWKSALQSQLSLKMDPMAATSAKLLSLPMKNNSISA